MMQFVRGSIGAFFVFVDCFGALGANPRHVVIVVWDGMRPDFVTEQYAPNLSRLAREGVSFAHHHAVYPSATEVNGTAIATGAYPAHSGLVGNREFRPEINPLAAINTEAPEAAAKGDKLSGGHYFQVPTLPELVRKAGKTTAVAGAKPIALLLDRAPRESADAPNLFAGNSLPPELAKVFTNRYGQFPKDTAIKPSRIDWTVSALLDWMWSSGVPDLTMVWMNQPDAAQHASAPGAPESLAAIRNSDDNLGRILRALDAKGVRTDTDIMVVSDHGCSTISVRIELVDEFKKAGLNALREFSQRPKKGDVLVVNNSGSALIYVIEHDAEITRRVVEFLQQWKHSGVILTRASLPGTFALREAHLDSPQAPDVFVSFHWTEDKNTNGTAGMVVVDHTGASVKGAHVSLSPFDMHNTLIGAGPGFKHGMVDELPSGNIDVAPTALWLLGIPRSESMDGRILNEALTKPDSSATAAKSKTLEARQTIGPVGWRQYLKVTEVNGAAYCDEGNGEVSEGR